MAKAQICWATQKEGANKAPSNGSYNGHHYVMVARFEGDETWPEEAWSLVLDFHKGSPREGCRIADIRFLAPGAPEHLLTLGNRFGLYEGSKCVATGEIVADPQLTREGLTAHQS